MTTGLHRTRRPDEVGRGRIEERALNRAKEDNPFTTGIGPGGPYGAVDAQSRIGMVKNFTIHQCYRALKAPGLQLAVQRALERRIRKLRVGIEKGGTG